MHDPLPMTHPPCTTQPRPHTIKWCSYGVLNSTLMSKPSQAKPYPPYCYFDCATKCIIFIYNLYLLLKFYWLFFNQSFICRSIPLIKFFFLYDKQIDTKKTFIITFN